MTERDWVDAHLVNAALDIHADDPAFGYRFIADELPEKGFTAGENRVQRLCKDHGIWSVFSKKRGLTRKPGPPVHDDLVERDFTAAAPNELWLTDITEHPTAWNQAHQTHRPRLPEPGQLQIVYSHEKCRPDGGMTLIRESLSP